MLRLITLACALDTIRSLATPYPAVNRRHAMTKSAAVAIGGGAALFLPLSEATADQVLSSSTVTLKTDVSFPLASFGLQIYDDDTAYRLTMTALEVGYRNFFASVLAGNQRGFARAIKDCKVPRSDLFICGSVVSNRVAGFDASYKATTTGWKRNMDAFGSGGIDYLDQIMLDYPGPDCQSIRGQWKAFEEMYDQKLTKTLSVSNFSLEQLDCVLENPNLKVQPVVNQLPFSVAYHPGGAQEIIQQNKKRGLLVQAWAPLGGSLGGRFSSKMKNKCADIGKRYNKSFAQVALRWIVQSGASFTTQSKKRDHFSENLDIFNFELSPDEMVALDGLA